MGKRDHGRLVHEIRDALIKHGFKPTSITQVETPEGLNSARAPGFKLEKHNDSKSVRLAYRTLDSPSLKTMDWNTRQIEGSIQMKMLIRYNAILEKESFTCIAINSHDPLTPYSLWRRDNKSPDAPLNK